MNMAISPGSNVSLWNAVHTVAVLGDTPETLSEIYRPEVNLAVLERVLPHRVAAYAEFLCAQPDRISFVRLLSIQQIRPALREHLPSHADIEPFIQDIEEAASMLGCLFGTDTLGLRLHSVDNAPCPRFHTDKVACRLLLTYRGRGTQWLEEGNLDRHWLGPAWPGDEGMNMCIDAERINEIACGNIALCKGEGWEGNEGKGLVHRSPPPLANLKRLVLTIDLV
jgi:hypothetical protein